MEPIIAGLILGLTGALHCIGMCGPLVSGLSMQRNGFRHLIYHLGRTLSYILIGVFFAIFGRTLHVFVSQQALSCIVGAMMILYFLIYRYGGRSLPEGAFRLPSQVSRYFMQFHASSSPLKYFVLGIGNGFLPCGLVYTAAIAAAAYGHIYLSVGFMIGFGIGTSPALTAVVLGLHQLSSRYSIQWLSRAQYMSLILGIILLIRGLGLGIPYLSPKYNTETEQVGSCCHKR